MTLPSIGPSPRYLEELRIGGGYGSAPDGGVDLDKAGNIAADGDLTIKGNVDVRGGSLQNSTGNVTIDAVNASADSTIYLKNSDATYKANVDIEGNLTAHGNVDVQGGTVRNSTGNVTIDAVNAAADSTIYLKNSDATRKANVDVEGNLTVGGAFSIGSGGVDKTWQHYCGAQNIFPINCAPAQYVIFFTGAVYIPVLDFDPNLDELSCFTVGLPKDYDGTALRFTIFWTATTGESGTVRWAVTPRIFRDDDSLQVTVASFACEDALIALNDLHETSGSIVPSGASSGDTFMSVVIRRTGTHANDTFASDARLIGVRVDYA